jgi:hypothetical protein
MNRFDRKIHSAAPNMDVFLEFEEEGRLSDVMRFAKENGIHILHVEFAQSKLSGPGQLAALLSLRLPRRHRHDEVLEEFRKLGGVCYIEEI